MAGTHGRSIWVLDHIEALGRLTPEAISEGRLFPIPPARQAHLFTGQFWFGAGEYFAPNPPPGAVVSYYLPQGQQGGVRLTVLGRVGEDAAADDGAGTAGAEPRVLGPPA